MTFNKTFSGSFCLSVYLITGTCLLFSFLAGWCCDYHDFQSARTRLWSLPMSAPLYVLVSAMDRLNLLLMVMWSIWFLNLLFGDVQVYLCVSLCGKTVDAIKRSFMAQKWTNRSPLSFLIPPRSGYLPIVLSSPSSA